MTQNINKWMRVCVCVHVQIDAIEYYSSQLAQIEEELRRQKDSNMQRPLGMAFVTLQTESMAA